MQKERIYGHELDLDEQDTELLLKRWEEHNNFQLHQTTLSSYRTSGSFPLQILKGFHTY